MPKKQKALDAFLEKADMPQSAPAPVAEDFWTMAGEPQPLPPQWKHPQLNQYSEHVWCVCVVNIKTGNRVFVGKYRDGAGGVSGRQQARALVDSLLRQALVGKTAPSKSPLKKFRGCYAYEQSK